MNLSIAIMKRVPGRTQSTEQHTPCVVGSGRSEEREEAILQKENATASP